MALEMDRVQDPMHKPKVASAEVDKQKYVTGSENSQK